MSIQALSDYQIPSPSDYPESRAGWDVEPSKAALLIHDMQDYFIDFYGDNSDMIRGVTNHIVAVKNWAKNHDMPIYYTAQPSEQTDEERGLLTDMWGAGLTTASPEKAAIIKPLAPEPSDTVLTKWRYSAFYRSDLAEDLKAQDKNQLIICGVYAHIGVLQTAADAFMQGVKPFVIGDAVADFSRDEHIWGLRHVQRNLGVVTTTKQLLALDKQAPLTLDAVRQQIWAMLDDEKPEDDEILMDYGLDSMQVMILIESWQSTGVNLNVTELAQSPTIASWWQLIEKQLR